MKDLISKYISNINKLNYKSLYALYKELNTIFDLDDELYPYLKDTIPNINEFWPLRTPELWLTNFLKQDFKIKYNKNNVVWYLGDQWIFHQDNKNKYFRVYYYAAWSIFNREYDMQYGDIQDLYRRVVLDPPELKELTPKPCWTLAAVGR